MYVCRAATETWNEPFFLKKKWAGAPLLLEVWVSNSNKGQGVSLGDGGGTETVPARYGTAQRGAEREGGRTKKREMVVFAAAEDWLLR